ncbi:MAG: hypothetical protein R6X14_09940, partial [bacterium]
MKAPRVLGLLLLCSVVASGFSLGDSTVTRPRVDYDRGLVYLEQWRGDLYLGTELVLSLEEFRDHQLKEAMRAS